MDVTHYAQIRQEYEDTRLVIGQIFLDNYDEVTSAMNDKDISNLGKFRDECLSRLGERIWDLPQASR